MLREALDFPTQGEHGSTALLVGSGLLVLAAVVATAGSFVPASSALSPLLFVALVVYLLIQLAVRGYYVRVHRAAAAHRDPVAPSFGDVGSLLRDGLAAVAIGVVYLLPSGLLFLLALGGTLATAVENPLALRDPTSIAAAETIGGLAALLGLFGLLAALYLVPGAVTLYAHRGEFRAAFDLRTVVEGTVSEDYAVGWVLTVVFQALLAPIAILLYVVLVGFVLRFVLGVAVRYVWARSLGTSLGFEPPAVDREGITPASGDDREDGRSAGSSNAADSTAGSETDPMADESTR